VHLRLASGDLVPLPINRGKTGRMLSRW
jgi:hypothetical protein